MALVRRCGTPDMTPTQRRTALQTIGWSQRGLAARLGWDDGTVRRWLRQDGIAPADVDTWLERLAEAHAANPAPVRDGRS
jgi:ribosome-binding protein aMBF1 (putative translation factor)